MSVKPWVQWRTRLYELLAALVMVSAIISAGLFITQNQRSAVPASAWFRVNEVFVPDHRSGENPAMIYDRVIYEQFEGFWIVEAQMQVENGLWSNKCSGTGISQYDPGEVIQNNTTDLHWFMGKACDLDPGVYRLRITWTMVRPDWPPKRLFVLSNPFTVS